MALKAYITNAGITVLNKCVGRQVGMTFSKAEFGSGVRVDETACKNATALVTPYTSAAVTQYTTVQKAVYQNNSAKVTIQLSSGGMGKTETLTINEIGLYARDPESNADVLYCYATFGDTPDTISGSALFMRAYDLVVAVTGVTSVNLAVTPTGLQATITASGLLVGDGQGGVREAVAGVDYAAANHNHALNSANLTGSLPIAKGGTGATTASQARVNLEVAKVIYSETEPVYEAGAIWLQPIS